MAQSLVEHSAGAWARAGTATLEASIATSIATAGRARPACINTECRKASAFYSER